MFRTALLILSGNAASALLLLARNLIIARLIPVQDYGIASTFAVVMAVVEMASAFGLQQQIVQSKHGDDPHFQAALQGFQLLRGLASGGAMLLLAGPLARFLGIPEVIWAYQILALVPVLNALQHFDIHRLNRQMRFGPLILTGTVPAILALLAVWPLAVYMGDWRVMFWSIIVQTAIGAITSHLVAERPYRAVLDRRIIGDSVRFGWPLLANAVLMFLVFQGDKLVVGRTMGMEELAIFSMGITLTLTPTLVLAKSATNLFLPPLSRARAASPEFQKLADVTALVHIMFGGGLVIGTLLLGPALTTLLLGHKYAPLVPILAWMAILQGVRIFKGGPSTIALARGQTENAAVANLLRISLLPLAWWLARQNQDMVQVLALAILGEVLGAVVAFVLVRYRLGLDLSAVLLPMLFTAASMGMAGIQGWGLMRPEAAIMPAFWSVGLAIAFQVAAACTMRPLWAYARNFRSARTKA